MFYCQPDGLNETGPAALVKRSSARCKIVIFTVIAFEKGIYTSQSHTDSRVPSEADVSKLENPV